MLKKDAKIVVVDDDTNMRILIITILKVMGYMNIDSAADGKQALKRLKDKSCDFLVTDWNMPGMDGLELLKSIRADEELKTLPVLFVTAEAEKEKVLSAISEGATNYIVKPFSNETLEKKISEIFS